jgi:enoyl-CoA hydratase/carnithine racemase
MEPKYGDVSVTVNGHVATLEIHRPPHNFFDFKLIQNLADAFEALDNEPECRALMLCSEGKSFCAGANFANRDAQSGETTARAGENPLYVEGVRLFRCKKPIVAAIQGAAIGGGFGLALVADFRIATAEARFAANFVKLGIHPGFGLTYTLPRLIGTQKASLMFFTGRRITGEEALAWGLCDSLAEPDNLRDSANALAAEIAEGAPLALLSTRATIRQGLADAVKAQTDHEFKEQSRLFRTEDHREGVKAVTERRPGKFTGL